MTRIRPIFTKTFWLDALERSIKTAAQSATLGLALSDATPIDAFEIDWTLGVGFAAGGAVLSLLTSVGSASIQDQPTAAAFGHPSP